MMAVVLIAECLLLVCLARDFDSKDVASIDAIRLRMAAYAELKPALNTKNLTKRRAILSADQHEVLLGTLKKVEHKNAILVTVTIFALSVLVAAQIGVGVSTQMKDVFTIFTFSFILPLCRAFSGFVQLDQRNFRRLEVTTVSTAAWNLQRSLLIDLMRKEFAFRFAFISVRFLVIGLLLLMTIHCLETNWSRFP